MTEQNDKPNQEAEGRVESKVVKAFQQTREQVMQESADAGKIYLAMRNPGITDVYQAWVKNMDVVANSYSWGKDKVALRTRLLKVTNRIVAAGVTVLTAPELVVDALTWLPRKIPLVGNLFPDHLARRAQIRLAVSAKNEALANRGLMKVGGKVIEAINMPSKAISEAAQFIALNTNPHQIMAENMAGNIATKILYPKSK